MSGLYASIRDSIVAKGGHYCVSMYVAYKEGDELRIGNVSLKGAAASAWMEFKRSAPSKKDVSGKSVRAFYVDAVKVVGYEDAKKGGTAYRIPKFALTPTSDATNQQAVGLDSELQSFLVDYLKRPKAEASKPTNSQNGGDRDDDVPPPSTEDVRRGVEHSDPFDDDIPF